MRLNLEKRVCRKERGILYIYTVKVITQRKSDGFVIIRIYFTRVTINMVANKFAGGF